MECVIVSGSLVWNFSSILAFNSFLDNYYYYYYCI